MKEESPIDRIRDIQRGTTIKERVDYLLSWDYHKSECKFDYSRGVFSDPTGTDSFGSWGPMYTPIEQLVDICKGLPIDHPVSIELSNQANESLDVILKKSPEEVGRIFSEKQKNSLTTIASCGFEPIFDRVRDFANQIVHNPVLYEGSSESEITVIGILALGGYKEKHKRDLLEVFKIAREKGIFPSLVVKVLSEDRQEDAFDFFIECVSSCGSFDKEGYGRYVHLGLSHRVHFPITMDWLLQGFSLDEIKARFDKENAPLRNKLNAIFDFRHKPKVS